MAMIKCPECEKKISDKAASCPGCGCPLQPEAGVPNPGLDDVMRDNQRRHNNFTNFMEWMHEFNMNNLKIWRKPW